VRPPTSWLWKAKRCHFGNHPGLMVRTITRTIRRTIIPFDKQTSRQASI
jgi:hypothetical protein